MGELQSQLNASKTISLSTMQINNLKAPHVGSIRVLQLQRDTAKNAISRQLLAELSEQIEDIHNQDLGQTSALVLASALDDVFCAGADLKERKGMSGQETQDFLASLRKTFFRLSTLPVPSIACVSGMALGGGLELALCCHLRVFSSNAVVGLPETRLAIIPGAGGTYRLPQLIGTAHARDLILTGRRVLAKEASDMGLCNRLVAAEQDETSLDAQTKRNMSLLAGIQLAQTIANGAPVALSAAIRALAGGSEAAENAAYESVLKTNDRVEALKAFGEKRSPTFTGK